MRFACFDRWDKPKTDLTGITSATWTSGVDGTRTLEVTATGESDIGKGDRLVFTDPRGRLQEAIVVSPEHRREETRIITSLVCKGSVQELDDTFIEDKRNRGATAAQCLAKALEGTRWTVGTVEGDGTADLSFYHVSVLEAVESIAETFGLEITASYLMDAAHTRVTDRALSLVKTQGDQTSATPRRFEYGHDLKGITRTVDATGVKTRLYGYGKGLPATDEDGNQTGGYGRRIDFSDINNGKPYVEDPAATAIWGLPGPSVSTMGKNLVTGGGFERKYGDGWLFIPNSAFLDALVKQDGDVTPYEGKIMLRMGTDTSTCATSAICDHIDVKGATEYQLTLWTHGAAGQSCSMKITQNVNVYPTSNIVLDPPVNTGRWTKTTRRFTTHAKCSAIRVWIENPIGTIYLDDMSLSEVTTTGIHPAEGIYENGDCEDKQQLLNETKAELKRRSTPTVSYEADVLTFTHAGMNTTGVALGDRVLLVDTTFTPDLRLSGRVLQLEEDLLDPALTVITIGNIIERFTASNRNAEQRLDRVVANAGAWNTSSQQITQNASKWDQVAQTVVDNGNRWNTTADTLDAKATVWNQTTDTLNRKSGTWDATTATLTARQPQWDATTETVTAGQADWDKAATIADAHAQAIRQSTSGITFHHGDTAITLGDAITLTDASGTWTFTEGTFVKQEPTE
ncbi:phage tail spike protein [Bifidobacterium callitrichos]|uniref:Wiskott-Aldrich syndrome protein-like protein 1 n=1 Tax=Bifidobacterium callitrichos DSM 23973 TaxID=1437609 RepID=A0A086ZVL4_9BIFI|nr:phage tail spike protein [Bifidobacterium callitrichos]KFI50564.1 wiskott-Aldrich syndrome protein-like protein 1 [Bifidobacterium callitrichos DSM 23973]